MTEFEIAYEFLKQYVDTVTVAARQGEPAEEWSAFLRYCTGQGIEPSEERLSLARDIAATAHEYFACPDENIDDGDGEGIEIWESRRSLPRSFGGEDLDDVPFLFLADTLECRGWRLEFLGRSALV